MRRADLRRREETVGRDAAAADEWRMAALMFRSLDKPNPFLPPSVCKI